MILHDRKSDLFHYNDRNNDRDRNHQLLPETHKLETDVKDSREAQYLLSEKYATKAEVAEIKATMQKLTDNIDYIKEHTTKNEDFIRVMTRLESKIDNYCSK